LEVFAFGADRTGLALDLAQALADAVLADGRDGATLVGAGAGVTQRLDGHALSAGAGVEVGAAALGGALRVERARGSEGTPGVLSGHGEGGSAAGRREKGGGEQEGEKGKGANKGHGGELIMRRAERDGREAVSCESASGQLLAKLLQLLGSGRLAGQRFKP